MSGVAAPIELVKPGLLRKDLCGKVSANGHVASFCRGDRRHTAPPEGVGLLP
jgi:hypothetical protein